MNKQKRDSYWLRSLQLNQNQRVIETKVVGVTYDGRQAVVAKLCVGEDVLLRREPYNPHDVNAIRVERQDETQIGYINRYLASDLAPLFDVHGDPVPANVTQLLGDPSAGYNLGVKIRFCTPGT